MDINLSVEADNRIGIGTKLVLKDSKGEVYDTAEIVIFGDVNGDGWYDGRDATIVNCLVNGLLSESDVSKAEYMAADCNHDGIIDSFDVDILNQAGILLADVDQSKSEEELLKTSSAYVEYLNLIDQTVETEADEEEHVCKFNFFDMLLNLIKIIIVIKTVIVILQIMV